MSFFPLDKQFDKLSPPPPYSPPPPFHLAILMEEDEENHEGPVAKDEDQRELEEYTYLNKNNVFLINV